MRRLHILVAILVMSALFTGCAHTTTASRVYTVAQIENGVSIAYNDKLEFVQVFEDGSIHKHSGAGVTAMPALQFVLRPGDYSLQLTDLPNCYSTSFESLCHYLYTVNEKTMCTFDLVFVSWRELEVYAYSEDWTLRCLWNIDGSAHLYFVDKSGNPIEPLYTNEEN